jgi:hypothetical protein
MATVLVNVTSGTPKNVDTTVNPAQAHPFVQVPLLDDEEKRAPIAILTTAQSTALLACLKAGTLFRSCGIWTARPDQGDHPMSGITIADLAREGFMIINIAGKSKSARLTAKGSWFARTIASTERELAGDPAIEEAFLR